MKEFYVYVPFADAQMDSFASALVELKNKKNRFFGHHTLILRPDQGNTSASPLSVVGSYDRLYLCIHGASKRAGVGVYHTRAFSADGDKKVRHEVAGEDLAEQMVDLGLANKSIDVLLWTCWGGGKENEDRDGTTAGDHDHRSFTLRFATGLKKRGRKSLTVTGYTQLVDLGTKRLTDNGGKKKLQIRLGEDNYQTTSDHKIQFKVTAI
jgi:hypothetical protein